MMKIILQILAIFSVLTVQAQYTLTDKVGNPITNGQTVTAYYDASDTYPEAEFDVEVTSQNSNDFRFQILSTNQGVNAENWVCTNFGLCYPPTSTDIQVELLDDQTRELQLHFNPNGDIEDATVVYRITEVGNTANTILFKVLYKASATGVEELNSNIKMEAYPNPANQFCTIEYDVKEDLDIYLYNITGEKVESYHINTGTGSINIDASNLNNGIYIYQTVSKSNVITSNYLIINH